MLRREFLCLAVGGALANKPASVLVHEHVLVDFVGADQIRPGRYDREEVFRIHREHQKIIGGLLRLGQEQGEIRRDLPAEEIAQILRQMIFGTLLFWSLVGIYAITALLGRSLRWGIYCVIPSTLAVLINFAVMGWMNIPLGVATSMFAA